MREIRNRMAYADITFTFLMECFHLDVETGCLFWKRRPPHHFRNEAAAIGVNAVHEGRIAGTVEPGKKRVVVVVGGRKVFAHRVVFAISRKIDFEAVPPIIDHKDGNSLNNRPDNLRPATPLQSVHNTGDLRNNTTGAKGVRPSVTEGKFIAVIKSRGALVHLGTFLTKEEAAAAYRGAAKIVHGEYMRQ